jgi:hypothetical protein
LADVAAYARLAGMLTQTPNGVRSARELLETVNRRLADVVSDPDVPPATYTRLVALRDTVGAHLLAAASLDDVVPDRARALLARASDAVVRSAAPRPEQVGAP